MELARRAESQTLAVSELSPCPSFDFAEIHAQIDKGKYNTVRQSQEELREWEKRFAGDWEIVEYQRNPGAILFWRRVLAIYSRGRYTERSRNGEVHQRFTSRASAAR